MNKPLLAILLLLPLSVSAGELDGKAIICIHPNDTVVRPEWEQGTPRGFAFNAGGVTRYWLRTKGTKAVLRQSDEHTEYAVTTKTVRWRKKPLQVGGITSLESEEYKLDRENLVLLYLWSHPDADPYLVEYNCEVTSTQDAMLSTMESARLQMQKRIDEDMKDNKI